MRSDIARLPALSLSVIAVAAAAIPLLATRPASACSVPVFRYALERWPPDPYGVFVFHKGPLSDDAKKAVEILSGGDGMEPTHYANLMLRVTDLLEDKPPENWPIPEKLPSVQVWAPQGAGGEKPIWTASLTVEAAKSILDSPIRKEIANRILKGESAVWVLLESGKKKDDDTAAAAIQTGLDATSDVLALPQIDPMDMRFLTQGGGAPPLKMAFSILRVARDDPKEKIFLEMLLRTEPDLMELEGPMALPVFGRGRALYALANKGINTDNILEACAFMAGPCSCEIKNLNPGLDMLVNADWDGRLMGDGGYQEFEVPELTGYSEFAVDDETTTQTEASTTTALAAPVDVAPLEQRRRDRREAATAKSRSTLLVTIAAALVALIGAVGAASFALRARQP